MFEAFSFSDNSNDYRTTALRRIRDGSVDLVGKVVVITGGTGALGKQLAQAMYHGGATVVITARSASKGEKAKAEILEQPIPASEEFSNPKTSQGSIVPMVMDLLDYESIEAFSKELKEKFPGGIYTLINNAGMVPGSAYKPSKYGVDTTFQSNFVSTVFLTELLIPQLKNFATKNKTNARIINVSSMSHANASKPIKWETIPSTENTFGGYNKDYAESKWLLTAYTCHLSRRSDMKDTVGAYSADPGVSPDSSMWDQQIFVIRFMARYVFYHLTKKSNQAAGCAAHLVAADEATIESGGYYQSGVLVPPMREDTRPLPNGTRRQRPSTTTMYYQKKSKLSLRTRIVQLIINILSSASLP